MKVEKMTLQEAVKNVLNKDISTYKLPKTEINNTPRKIIIPEKASTNKDVIEYLKNRGIDEDIILDCINKKLIYQENKTNNVVFVGYDYEHNIKYAGCRSTNEKRMKILIDKGFSLVFDMNFNDESCFEKTKGYNVIKIKLSSSDDDNINSIIEDYEVNTIDVDSMITYEEPNTDCFQNMQTFIDNIRNLTLAD